MEQLKVPFSRVSSKNLRRDEPLRRADRARGTGPAVVQRRAADLRPVGPLFVASVGCFDAHA